jgi:hypothetical protein
VSASWNYSINFVGSDFFQSQRKFAPVLGVFGLKQIDDDGLELFPKRRRRRRKGQGCFFFFLTYICTKNLRTSTDLHRGTDSSQLPVQTNARQRLHMIEFHFQWMSFSMSHHH